MCLLVVGSAAYGADVARFDVFEVTFTSEESFDNPFWDPSVSADFTSPGGQTIHVDGFYFGGKEWKVRFAPGREGRWTYVATMKGKGAAAEQKGEFNCVKSSKHGFVRVAKKNPFRFEYDDGTPFYPVGYQSGGLLAAGHDGPAPDGKWRSAPLEDYLKDFDGAANLNRIQLGCGDRRGHQVLTAKDGLDRYDADTCAKLDETYRLYRKYNVSQIVVLNQDMSMYGGAKTCWGSTHDTVNYKSVNAANLPMQDRYLRYMVARYGAFVDIWELFNEDGCAPNDYLAHLAKVIRDADPYGHLITTNYERPEQPWCEVVCPHEYMSIPANEVDGHLINEFARLKAYGKPVQYTEFGNKPIFSNDDPEKWRVVLWTCWTREVGMLFWSMSGTRTVPRPDATSGNANMYFGAETRKHCRILNGFVKDVPVDARPIFFLNTNHNSKVRAGGVGNGDVFVFYVHHVTAHDAAVNPLPLTLRTGKGRFRVTWIDPATGEVTRQYESGTREMMLAVSVPPIKVDAACKLERLAEGQAADVAAAPVEAKVLFDFEDGKNPFAPEDDLKDVVSAQVVSEAGRATQGQKSLKVTVQPHEWPGVNTQSLPADWSGYEALRFDVVALDDMVLNVRIDDRKTTDYNTRFNSAGHYLTKGRNTVTVWLSDVAAKLDLAQIKALYVFCSNVEKPATFYLDNVRLEKRK